MSTKTEQEIFEDIMTTEDFAPKCDSLHCQETMNRGDHPAAYYTFGTCHHVGTWCEDRYAEYLNFDIPKFGGNLNCFVGEAHPTVITIVSPISGFHGMA